ncbi:MAG: biotin/lipoyl-binding protein, partial [Chlamydiae bacterium]|nr:biotin/lipoyl-binding protein [Chlamydiota bacterium]
MNNENKPSNSPTGQNISANNSNNTKPQLGAEQIKLLLSSMQKNQKEQSTFKKNLQSFINYIMKFTQRCVTQLDFFIKYVINKHELDKNDVMNTARGPVMFGTYVIFIFVILGGGWVVLAPLDSAERAIGFVIPSSKRKLIQSPQGGTVKEIYVLLGDQVKAGDPIVALDEVQAKAQYEVSLNQYKTYLATEARLVAERDNLKEIPFDQFLLDRKDEPHVATLLRSEDLLFQSRQETYKKTLESLTQRHLQLEKQLEGLNARKQSAIKNKAVNRELLKSYRDLYNKGHLQKAKLLEFEARTAEVESNLLVTESEIAKINE